MTSKGEMLNDACGKDKSGASPPSRLHVVYLLWFNDDNEFTTVQFARFYQKAVRKGGLPPLF
jgi:hypothetical protein